MSFGVEVGESVGTIPHGLKRLVTMNEKQKFKAKVKRFGLYNVEIKPIEITLAFSSLRRVILLLLFFEYSKRNNGIIERRNWESSVWSFGLKMGENENK
ncbi:hypothetical protein B7492_32115 (plasmid) [Bacillus mycoides]|uniref:Uncharacterized protein n=1 Tax=Bacillus mycoides TaxID=1405 RepID=A0A1W6AIM9_BACMY|nr:hypothetical protein B7492_32115 [Bacillus mycoides]